MKIIISPAKKMNIDSDSIPIGSMPDFLDETEQLLAALRQLSREELKKLWKCNDSILNLNISRLEQMDLRSHLTPAILAYEGIQYRYMAPGVFTCQEFCYVQEHLRILSGFYGMLRPFDGVVPYRLEMQTKLKTGCHGDLYSFWGTKLAQKLAYDENLILNLASKEYSVCVSKFLPDNVQFLTCVFGEEKDGKIIEKGTMCKMARGEMVRWLAENQITNPEDMKAFDRLDYQYNQKRSRDDTLVFLRTKEEQ